MNFRSRSNILLFSLLKHFYKTETRSFSRESPEMQPQGIALQTPGIPDKPSGPGNFGVGRREPCLAPAGPPPDASAPPSPEVEAVPSPVSGLAHDELWPEPSWSRAAPASAWRAPLLREQARAACWRRRGQQPGRTFPDQSRALSLGGCSGRA